MGSEMTDTEINSAVARKLGKYPSDETIAYWKSQVTGAGIFTVTVADYCHDIKAAFEVLEYCDAYKIYHGDYVPNEVTVTLSKKRLIYYASAKTAPMAICLAFLKLQ